MRFQVGLVYRPTEVRVRFSEAEAEQLVTAVSLEAPFDNPLSYLIAVVRGEVEPAGMSSLAANLVVTEILDAARRSAATGETVRLDRR